MLLLSSALAPLLALAASVVSAQSTANATVVCVAGQCIQGFTNTTLGATLSNPDVASGSPILILPGQYTTSTNPQVLHQLLTSSSTKISPSSGFNASSVNLPLNLALQPGLAAFSDRLYSGESQFASLPNTPFNSSSSAIPLNAGALALSSDVWVAVTTGSGSSRMVMWDSVPDVSQLPGSPSLSLLDIQSTACSPPCSGNGVCSPSGQCICPDGFTGASCETCASGHFGPSCQACPAGCAQCDEGISGSGACLAFNATNPPASCNCLNGACGANGQCTCNAGWTTADNGTACAKCAPGFFLDGNGDCSACQLGCTACADGSGVCTTCASGFTQDANDRTKCDAVQAKTSTGTVCPDGSFSDGTQCQPCSSSCQTCKGPTSNDCIICGSGQFSLGGQCVPTDGNGVCQGSSMIANNNKHACDSCPAKCTACKIPNFNVASTEDQVQCSGCLPGFVLSQGKCVESCPTGTFLSPQDNLTCTACSSSCSSCAGSADFCLTCTNNQLASGGKCVSACPSNSVSSSGTCITCHPDCATCSGTAFTQCSSCPPDRPVLTNGRCLPTCSKNQFFDTTSSTCQACDSSCSSCSGSGPSNCLACASSSQTLQSGTCAQANCNGTSTVISGLGLCLSDLVAAPPASGTAPAPLPSITGLTAPAATSSGSGGRPLAWWEILLMALGCAFIFVAVLALWRRRMRRRRAARTQAFAAAKRLDPARAGWRGRLLRLGERVFGGPAVRAQREEMKLEKLRHAEAERHAREMEKLAGPSSLPSYYEYKDAEEPARRFSRHSESLYSQVTGVPRRGPEPRQPVRNVEPMQSRFSWTTAGASPPPPPPAPQTEAQRYAMSVGGGVGAGGEMQRGMYWLEPMNTGASKNPFRK